MNRMQMSLAVLAGSVIGFNAQAAETFSEALKESKFLVNWRLRYEGVDQAGFTDPADALTSRIRGGVQTGEWGKTSVLGELVYSEAIVDDFNSTVNGNAQYPVVADPGDFVAVNRFAITNKSLDNTTLTFGRQRIIHDDSRFVGNVGWRQNEQTFDGLRAQLDAGDVDVDLAYITQVNRVFGPDSPVGKWNGDIVLANASKPFAWGKLTGFVYGLDIDEAAALSTNTVGLRLDGAKQLASIKLLYGIAIAQQSDAGANANDFSENYYKLEGGIGFGKFVVALGQEVLGGDGNVGFTMPLATLHAFQGWGDKFLNTPAAGIDDSYMRFAYQVGAHGPFTAISLVGFYHAFDANTGSASFGDELDVSLVANTKRLSATLKYAAYEADTLFTDTDKLWLSLDYAF